MQRKDSVYKSIITKEEKHVSIYLYDNGIVDGDSISLYVNDSLVIAHAKLSLNPIVYELKMEKGKKYKITMFAENLGSIPPNTAYMIIKSFKKEWNDIYLSTDFNNNASVIIQADN